MQDEVNEKIVALAIRGAEKGFRVTGSVLKAAMRKYLQAQEKQKQQLQADKIRQKKHRKESSPSGN